MENARDARRRRILDRGSDRLAFIAGQAGSLPSDPATATGLQEDPRSSFVAPPSEDYATGFVANKASTAISETHPSSGILNNERQDYIKLNETEKEAEIKVYQTEPESYLMDPSLAQRSVDRAVDAGKSAVSVKKHGIFSSKEITDSILASENTRLICAIVIGLLVVLLNHGLFLGGEIVRNIINFRPLFLVLLTDIMIVLEKLMASQGANERHKERTTSRKDEYDWTDNVGTTLEVFFVFQKAITAVFMDCSICAVIIISGLGI